MPGQRPGLRANLVSSLSCGCSTATNKADTQDYWYYHANADRVIDKVTIYIWEYEEYCWKQIAYSMAELLTRYYHYKIVA